MHWHGSKALGWSQNHIGERTLLFVIPQKISSVRGRTCVAHHKRIKQISQRSPNMMRLYRPPQNVWHPRRGFPNVFLMALQRELSHSEDDRGPVGVYTCTHQWKWVSIGLCCLVWITMLRWATRSGVPTECTHTRRCQHWATFKTHGPAVPAALSAKRLPRTNKRNKNDYSLYLSLSSPVFSLLILFLFSHFIIFFFVTCFSSSILFCRFGSYLCYF